MANENVTIDLRGYRSNFSDQVSEGTKRVRVDHVKPDKSKNNDVMIVVWLEIIEGDDKGSMLVERLTLSEKAIWRVVNFMKAINEPVRRERFQLNVGNWRGRILDVEVADGDPYNGEVRSECKAFRRVKGAVQPAEPEFAEPWAQGPAGDQPAAAQPSDGASEFTAEGTTNPARSAPVAATGDGQQRSVTVVSAVDPGEPVDLDSIDL